MMDNVFHIVMTLLMLMKRYCCILKCLKIVQNSNLGPIMELESTSSPMEWESE